MTTSPYCANLVDIVNKIKDPVNHWGREELSIWGGQCIEAELLNFLNGWQLTKMPYRIWEYVSKIEFVRGTDKLPDDKLPPQEKVSLLEHGRMFGPGGDLTLRRDGAAFRWHFICKKGTPPEPPTTGNSKDFWAVEQNKQLKFHRWTDRALLWGKHSGNGRWHDDRVARAKLEYPTPPTPNGESWERVMIEYDTFSQAGQVQFVWLRELVEWKGEQDGNG